MVELKTETQKYLEACEHLKGLSVLTLKAYRIDLFQFLQFVGEGDWLSKELLVQYIEAQHMRYKPKSAKRKIACVKAFYRYMELENIIPDNPFHHIQIKYKEPIVLPKTIALNDVQRILKHGYDMLNAAETAYQKQIALRNVLILELLFSTGMRVSEISHLKLENLDLQSNTIYIYGKGSKERVMCIANSDIKRLLKKYLNLRKSNLPFLFLNKQGNRYSEQSIRNMINTYAKAANITQHITPHMFRHTFATALLEEDVNIRYIQQLLGHSSITTTQIYTHISTGKIRRILADKHPRNNFVF